MADWYAAPSGTPGGDGSIGDPWDLATALAATGSISAGDTLHLRGGTYSGQFTSSLLGASGNTVTIAAYQDEIPVVDMVGSGTTGGAGGSGITVEGDYTDWWRIWVTSSNTDRWQAKETSGWWLSTGAANTRLFFCVAHNCGVTGFDSWSPASPSLMHGCVSINNGYDDTDRGHGHALYIQNAAPDTKTVERCLFGPCFGGYSIHAYTEGGDIEDMTFRENVAYQGVLVGGGQPVDDAILDENHALGGIQMGYGPSVANVDATLTDNVTPDGTITQIGTWSGLSESGTLDAAALDSVYVYGSSYDNDRGLVVVYDQAEANFIEVDLSGLPLTVGRQYVLAHGLNPFAQGYTFTWNGTTNPVVRTDAAWVVASPLGHDAADAGSQVPTPIMSAPNGRMAFLLAPAAQWPPLTTPSAPEPTGGYTTVSTPILDTATAWWVPAHIDESGDLVDQSGSGRDLNNGAGAAAITILHPIGFDPSGSEGAQYAYFPGTANNQLSIAGLSATTAYDYTVTYHDDSTASGEETTDGSGNLVLGGTQTNFVAKKVKSVTVVPDGGGAEVAGVDFTDRQSVTAADLSFTGLQGKTWTVGRSTLDHPLTIVDVPKAIWGAGDSASTGVTTAFDVADAADFCAAYTGRWHVTPGNYCRLFLMGSQTGGQGGGVEFAVRPQSGAIAANLDIRDENDLADFGSDRFTIASPSWTSGSRGLIICNYDGSTGTAVFYINNDVLTVGVANASFAAIGANKGLFLGGLRGVGEFEGMAWFPSQLDSDERLALAEEFALANAAAPTSRRGLPGHRAPGIGVWIGV